MLDRKTQVEFITLAGFVLGGLLVAVAFVAFIVALSL